jgi:hypothetical protein
MIARVLERSVWLKGVTLFALLGWFAFTPMLTWHNALQRRVVVGAEMTDAFLRRTFAPYASMQWLNLKAPRANVAVYGEPRTFYLQTRYFWADDAHNNVVDYGRVRDGQTLVAELRRLETTHVLWNTRGPFGPPVEAINDAIARNLLTPRFEVNAWRYSRFLRKLMAKRPTKSLPPEPQATLPPAPSSTRLRFGAAVRLFAALRPTDAGVDFAGAPRRGAGRGRALSIR